MAGDMVTTFFTDFVMTSLFSASLLGDIPLEGVFLAGNLALEGVFLTGDLALEGVLTLDFAPDGIFFATFVCSATGVSLGFSADLVLEGVFLTGDFALDGVFFATFVCSAVGVSLGFSANLVLEGVFLTGDFALDAVFFTTFVSSAVGVSFGFSRRGTAFGVSTNFSAIATVFLDGVCCFLAVSFLSTSFLLLIGVFLLLTGVFFAEDTLGVRADLSRGVLGTTGLVAFSDLDNDFRFLGGDLDALLFFLGDFDSDFSRFAAIGF